MATVNKTIWTSIERMFNKRSYSATYPRKKMHKVEAVLEDRNIDDLLASISRDIAVTKTMQNIINK